MSNKKVWLITGAGRGLGLDIAKAALAAGHNVVATGRNLEKVTKELECSERLLVVKLDVTNPGDAEAAVKSAIERFGAIDVLVNNAANFYAGFFEELTQEQIGRQLSASLIGPGSEFSKSYKGHLKSEAIIGLKLAAAIISFAGFPTTAF